MQDLRRAFDMLEMYTAADLWPLPTYRELLFLK
jgi:glutamine synthetase type III